MTVGHLAAKARLVAAGVDLGAGTDERLEDLLARAKDDDASRQELIDLLDALGPEDPRTPEIPQGARLQAVLTSVRPLRPAAARSRSSSARRPTT